MAYTPNTVDQNRIHAIFKCLQNFACKEAQASCLQDLEKGEVSCSLLIHLIFHPLRHFSEGSPVSDGGSIQFRNHVV
jgi:hypothetical protein